MSAFIIEIEDIGEALFLRNKNISPAHAKQVEIGLWCELAEDKIFYQMELLNGDKDILETLNWDIQEARRLNIPGLYTVPELGVKDAPFWKVLEAVKGYYEARVQRSQAQS